MKVALPVEDVVSRIHPGSTLMISGFIGIGSPHRMIDALVSANIGNLTVIANDTGIWHRKVNKFRPSNACYC